MSMPRLPRALGIDGTGIRRAAVIGAGSMGGGIAAQFANAGIPVDLLDVAGKDTSSRDAAARAGIERQLKSGGFMHPDAASLVKPGNIEDDLGRLAETDWIIEAVTENLEIKEKLYRGLEAVCRPGAIVSSNTSTIPRAVLARNMGKAFAANFLITHFFNPPRAIRLVEIVGGPENSGEIVGKAAAAAEIILGKTVIAARDTPGFIANRIGCYWLAVAVLEARRLGLTIEEADAVNAALGFPRTGVFGLLDLVGIDLVPHVWGSLMKALPADDDLQNFDLPSDGSIAALIAEGRFGRKAKAGFYRRLPDGANEALDLATGAYRAARPCKPAELPGAGRDLAALLESSGKVGEYAWTVLSRVATYSAGHAETIAGDPAMIDIALQLGYAWREGPLQLADRYGAAKFADRLASEGRQVPALLETAAKRGGFYPASTAPGAVATSGAARKVLFGNKAASVLDMGDGVARFEIHTKMNSFAEGVFDTLDETLLRGGKDFRALVIGNDDPRAFSAGADLAFIVDFLRAGNYEGLERYIARGQALFLNLKYAAFPVVAAAHGFALGGGCEFSLHADAIVAHCELTAGLPETKVGLIPGWGGCTQMLLREQRSASGPKGPVATALSSFERIYSGAVSSSAPDAFAKGILRQGDGFVMNRGQLLAAARDKAIALAQAGYVAPERAGIAVSGPSGKLGIMSAVNGNRAAGRLSDHDVLIADMLAEVLTGGPAGDLVRPMAEEDLMALEREGLLQLARMPQTQARIEHMLATGKPLRN